MARLSSAVFEALKQVRLVALQSLTDRGRARPAAGPLSVSNRGLARRFELMGDADLTHHLRHADADVAYLVFCGLQEVLYGADAAVKTLASDLCGEFATSASATAAALLAVDHYDPRIKPSIPMTHPGHRLGEIIDAAEPQA
ncbi:MAG: hypothetical protein QM754_00140 [Tepidisphaeraceae bacterium]